MRQTIGLVIAGGGARGAYEAGALSVLLPGLARRGERPTLLVGTSVGAINAAYLAATQQLDPDEQASGLVERWSRVTKEEVIRPIMLRQAPLAGLRYAGELLGLPRVRLASLLDPAPLERNLRRWIPWTRLHENVRERRLEAIVTVATAARSGKSVGFVEGPSQADLGASHVIDYVRARLTVEHLRASAAIPLLFPPVRVEAPAEAKGWYVDGGTRLNTPIKPALDLGARRVVVVGTEAVTEHDAEGGRHDCEPPDFADGALHVLHGALVDPLIEDVLTLGNVNAFFSDERRAPAAREYREARGKPPYRQVPYVFVAPPRRGSIGEVASEIFRSRYGGLKALRSPDFPLLSRLLGGDGPAHGELLSYLLFDTEFIEALIEMGKSDARRWLDDPRRRDDPWQVEPLDVLTRPSRPALRLAESRRPPPAA